MAKTKIFTQWNKNTEKWENKKTGNDRPSSTHETKEKAIDKGKKMAKELETEHVIKNKDGKISNPNSYGGDPIPPRDKKK
jgi:hypothetical protein